MVSWINKVLSFVDDVAMEAGSVIGNGIAGVADIADSVSYRGTQIAKDVTGPVTRTAEVAADLLKR